MKRIVYNKYVCKGACPISEYMPCTCEIPRYANEEKDEPKTCLLSTEKQNGRESNEMWTL